MFSKNIYRLASRYAMLRGMSLASLGTYAVRDGTFLKRLPVGRVTLRRAELLLQYISDNWPEGIDWPSYIDRPKPARRRNKKAA